jgi:hypothetical protein
MAGMEIFQYHGMDITTSRRFEGDPYKICWTASINNRNPMAPKPPSNPMKIAKMVVMEYSLSLKELMAFTVAVQIDN